MSIINRGDADEPIRIEIEAPVIANTARAILVRIGNLKHWIPTSIIHEESEVWTKGDKGTIVLPRWFCEKRGIDCE